MKAKIRFNAAGFQKIRSKDLLQGIAAISILQHVRAEIMVKAKLGAVESTTHPKPATTLKGK